MSTFTSDPGRKLRLAVDDLLNGALGVSVGPTWGRARPKWLQAPLSEGLLWGVGFGVFFCLLPWIILGDRQYNHLIRPALWSTGYIAFAVTIARATSAAVQSTIATDIIPLLSDRAAISIYEDLRAQFKPRRINFLSFSVGIVAALVSLVAVYYDLAAIYFDNQSIPLAAIYVWCVGLIVLYITAAQATDVARFYGLFAKHLHEDAERLHRLNPAHSPLIIFISRVARLILIFWFGIVCSITVLIPLSLQDLPRFVLFLSGAGGFFSMGVGTVVFLLSESRIRHTVSQVAAESMASVEREIRPLLDRKVELSDAELSRLFRLSTLQEELAGKGSFRSAVLTALSVAAPFLGPVVAGWKLLTSG